MNARSATATTLPVPRPPFGEPRRSSADAQSRASGERGRDQVVIVHDYLTQRGGAERVVVSMMRAFPEAAVVTSLYEPRETYPEFRGHPVQTLPLNRVSALRHHHRFALPLLASAFANVEVAADLVVCSSSGWAHGVRSDGRKLVYCHTPARWLYEPEQYLLGRGWGARSTLYALEPLLRPWDQRAAASADRYLVNSRLIQRQAYGIEAEVLPPPPTIDVNASQLPVDGIEPAFYLVIARLNGYKNVAAVVEAFTDLPRDRLMVVGAGPERGRLERLATSNVRFLGTVGDDQLRWLYANCRALVAASYEDYGLTPLECAAFGKPSVVLAWGGYLETVLADQTGVFFPEPASASIRSAVRRLASLDLDDAVLRAHAERHSERVFVEELRRRAFEP